MTQRTGLRQHGSHNSFTGLQRLVRANVGRIAASASDVTESSHSTRPSRDLARPQTPRVQALRMPVHADAAKGPCEKSTSRLISTKVLKRPITWWGVFLRGT